MRTLTARLALTAGLACLLASCATTRIVNSWIAPDHHKESVKKILVLGISADAGIRRSYEDAFAKRLTDVGYAAIPGYQWVPDATKLDKDAIAARMKDEGVTHVLVSRLISSKQVATYHEPTAVYVGYGAPYYGGWSSFYSVGYTAAVSPGYTTVNDVVTLETNLYDAARKEGEALVWSGHSETWLDSPSTGSKIPEVISMLVYKMQAEHAI